MNTVEKFSVENNSNIFKKNLELKYTENLQISTLKVCCIYYRVGLFLVWFLMFFCFFYQKNHCFKMYY